MLEIILSIVSLISILIIGIVLYFMYKNINNKVSDRMNSIVDQINKTHKYEYDFDEHQNQNIKNIDYNVTSTYKNLLNLQNNVQYLENTYVSKDEIISNLHVDKLDASRINIANNTNSNNIIFEAGRTADNSNVGFSAINFNGYYDKVDKLINKNKSRWRIYADQTSNNDLLSIDQYNGSNINKYISMNNGITSLHDNINIVNSYSNMDYVNTNIAQIVNDNSIINQLLIVGNKSADGYNHNVGIANNLGVYGDSTIYGHSKIFGNSTVRGTFCIGDTCITEADLQKIKNL